jgi:hypothetical protein
MIRSADTLAGRCATALLLFAVAACGSSDGTTGPAPAIAISLSASTLTVTQGSSGSVTVTLTRQNGFNDPVAVTVEGLPAGVTAAAPTIAVGQTSGTLTLSATAAAAAATSALTVRASGPGVSAATAALSLVVQLQPGAFTMTLAPTSLTVAQGAQGSATLTIARSGSFTGPVALAATGLPNGVTASFNPASVTGTTSTLTLSASAAAAVGSATVTVTGSGSGPGVTNQSAALVLTVQATPQANVSVAFCPGVGNPLWVAFQDGPAGSWVRSTAVNGVYPGVVTSGRGGIAYVTPVSGGGFATAVRYGSLAELQAFNAVFCLGATGAGKTVNVNVAGTTAGDGVRVGLGSALSVAAAGVVPALENVPDGALDLLAARTAGGVVTRLFAQRDVTPAAGSTVNVDFNGANAFAPVTAPLTIVNLGTDQVFVNHMYRTANRTQMLYYSDQVSTSSSRTIMGFPPVAGSFHQSRVLAAPQISGGDRLRSIDVVFGTVAPKTLTLGPEMGAVAVTTVATTPTLRAQAVVPAAAPYNQSWNVSLTQGSAAQYRSAIVQTTIGYVGGSPATVILVVPDFSAVSGYQVDWGLKAGATTNWTSAGIATTGFGPQGQPAEGASQIAAVRLGVLAAQP